MMKSCHEECTSCDDFYSNNLTMEMSMTMVNMAEYDNVNLIMIT